MQPRDKPLSKKNALKVAWFERGAAALDAVVGPHLDAAFGPTRAPRYMCPLCRRFFVRSFLFTGKSHDRLTIEDVQPKKLGGRPLVLTCGRCNHTAGRRLDSNASSREQLRHALSDRAGNPRPVTLSIDEIEVDGTYEVGAAETRIIKIAKGQVDACEAFLSAVFDGPRFRQFRMTFHDTFRGRWADISWLRAAYLAWFAVLGYGIVFDPARDAVRQQIKEPKVERLRGYISCDEEHRDFSDRWLIRVLEPAELRALGIRVGPYTVLIPEDGDNEFFDRIRQIKGKPVPMKMEAFTWPDGPSFGVDAR